MTKPFPSKSTVRETVTDYLVITLAMGIISFGVYFFMVSCNLVIGNVSGLSLVLSKIIPVRISILTFIMNALLLILSVLLIGRDFGAKTIYTTAIMSVYLFIFEIIFPNQPPLCTNQLVNILCYSLIISYGQTIIFNRNASAGGFDIVAKILNKYLHIDLGKGLILAGVTASLTSLFVYDIETVVLSILGTYIGGVCLDRNLANFQLRYRVSVITSDPQPIQQYITDNLHCGVSVYQLTGGYHKEPRHDLVSVLDKNEYQKLMDYLRIHASQVFVTVTTTGEVVGGFRTKKGRTLL
ncbi:MAG: YitT family protein [Eubacteriales bacterium]|nr:YitT family protein [Eubacteriales bacterium]